MKIYILHSETFAKGYGVEAFANKKEAISRLSRLKKNHKKNIDALKKDPVIIIKDIPITKKGLLQALNYFSNYYL
tara:strand:- start:256 stop:480 length:225 start_codon:yes stop_codon:yes gene_type:complete